MNELGAPVSRKDGPLKVTGTAPYVADHCIPSLAYAAVVQSSIAKGSIKQIDSKQASGASGVVAILTHENMPHLVPLTDYSNEGEYSEHHHPCKTTRSTTTGSMSQW